MVPDMGRAIERRGWISTISKKRLPACCSFYFFPVAMDAIFFKVLYLSIACPSACSSTLKDKQIGLSNAVFYESLRQV